MTLAIMTRASLAHTGRPLLSGRATAGIYAAVIAAALARAIAPLFPDDTVLWLHAAAFLWLAAFVQVSRMPGRLGGAASAARRPRSAKARNRG
jgi:uncharacterized protein involved in response to NO